jgi:hypothetical protein
VLRVSYELDADAVGHDLGRGQTQFTRLKRPAVLTRVDVDQDGMPADLTHLRTDVLSADLDDEPVGSRRREAELAPVG